MTSSRRLHLVSVVQLYKALGGGWSPEMDRLKGDSKGS
jgi:multidrug efflux system outer membrane protein